MMFLFYTTVCLFLLLCALLSAVILLQESKSMGLGASFGGDAGESLFGTSTADILKKFTGWLSVIFMAACIVLSLWSAGVGRAKVKDLPITIEQEAHTKK